MKAFEVEVRKLKILCKTPGCLNPGGGHKSNHRNVKDFSKQSKLAAISSFKTGIKMNAANGSPPTQDRWKRTTKGWLCPECK